MKKLMFFVAVLATGLSSCGGSSSNSTNPIVGTWKLTAGYTNGPKHLETITEFSNNGTVIATTKATRRFAYVNPNITVVLGADNKYTSSGTTIIRSITYLDNRQVDSTDINTNFTSSGNYTYNVTDQSFTPTSGGLAQVNGSQVANKSTTYFIKNLTASGFTMETELNENQNPGTGVASRSNGKITCVLTK